MDTFLRRLDRLIFLITFLIIVYPVFFYFEIFFRYVFFATSVGFLFYGFLFFLYYIPHYLRVLSSSYIAEDMAEQKLEDDVVVFC